MPPRGSVQDAVLREVVERERYETFEKSAFLGRILGFALHVKTDVLQRLEERLSLAIFQTAYDPVEIQKQMEQARDRAVAQREERLREAKLLAKVASYSDDIEDEAQEAFQRHMRGSQFQGISNPWKKTSSK